MPTKCSGQCCRNPYGVCTHRRQCAHHAPERREAYREAENSKRLRAAQAAAPAEVRRYRWRADA